MTLSKAKGIIAQLLDDYPALEATLDAAPATIGVALKLDSVAKFAKTIVDRKRRREIDAAILTIRHNIQISSYN